MLVTTHFWTNITTGRGKKIWTTAIPHISQEPRRVWQAIGGPDLFSTSYSRKMASYPLFFIKSALGVHPYLLIFGHIIGVHVVCVPHTCTSHDIALHVCMYNYIKKYVCVLHSCTWHECVHRQCVYDVYTHECHVHTWHWHTYMCTFIHHTWRSGWSRGGFEEMVFPNIYFIYNQ